MDLPINFPPGTRFWQLIIDAVADLTTGEFMLLDGSRVADDRADRLREQIMRDGVEISEAQFRESAPPSLSDQLKATREAIDERAKRDPEFAKALAAALAKEPGLFEQCEQMAWDSLRHAESPDDVRESIELLLKIAAKKQNVSEQ